MDVWNAQNENTPFWLSAAVAHELSRIATPAAHTALLRFLLHEDPTAVDLRFVVVTGLLERLPATFDLEEWTLHHAPRAADVEVVIDWLRSGGLDVPRRATNGLLIQFTGTVQQFNDLFDGELRLIERPSAQQGGNLAQPAALHGSRGTGRLPGHHRARNGEVSRRARVGPPHGLGLS